MDISNGSHSSGSGGKKPVNSVVAAGGGRKHHGANRGNNNNNNTKSKSPKRNNHNNSRSHKRNDQHNHQKVMQHRSQHHHRPNDGGAAGFFDDIALSTDTNRNQKHRPPYQHHPSHHQQQNHHHYPKKKHNNDTNNNSKGRSRSPKRSKSPKAPRKPATMTVIVNRVRLYDVPSKKENYESHSSDEDATTTSKLPMPNIPVAPYSFVTHEDNKNKNNNSVATADLPPSTAPAPTLTIRQPLAVAVTRAPYHAIKQTAVQQFVPEKDIIDTSFPNPCPTQVHDKYWAQRRRLFSRFDMGIQMDEEGWYSVTPEVIADHVAQRVAVLGPPNKIILDAFCGMGGNAIAFAKIPHDQISLVVCVDIDRSKLKKAAYNACLYDIPPEKLVFVEGSSLFILEQCYQDGVLQLDRLVGTVPPPNVTVEQCAGFFIGGLGLLPRRIDAVFMDPPWGGVDYNTLGKNGYDLEKHMKIKVGPSQPTPPPEEAEEEHTVGDDFFDSFGPSNTKSHHKGGRHRKKRDTFNQGEEGCKYMNGVELLKIAASATATRLVIYDMPRNTNKSGLGHSVLAAGYRGNIKLEEHMLNGRLKTATAYMGVDYSSILH